VTRPDKYRLPLDYDVIPHRLGIAFGWGDPGRLT
jgi:hypothetical protein